MTAKGPTLEEQIEAVLRATHDAVDHGIEGDADRLCAAAATLRSLAAREQEQSQSDAGGRMVEWIGLLIPSANRASEEIDACLQRAREEIMRLTTSEENWRKFSLKIGDKSKERISALEKDLAAARAVVEAANMYVDQMTPSDIEALLREAERKAGLLYERDLGIEEFHAMQLPLAKDLRALAVALRACADDAERYRWLRDGDCTDVYCQHIHHMLNDQQHGYGPETLDCAIDAARREGRG